MSTLDEELRECRNWKDRMEGLLKDKLHELTKDKEEAIAAYDDESALSQGHQLSE